MGNRVFEKLSDPPLLQRNPILIFAADPLASAGLHGLGREMTPHPHYRTRPEFLELLRKVTADGYIDGLLMTPADAEVLAVDERLFEAHPVTPVVRVNAETAIWNPRFGRYRQQQSYPFQTVPLSEAAYCVYSIDEAKACHIRLGLYSITLNNDVEADERTLNAYLRFAREVGETPDFDHILEFFLPNVNLPGVDEKARGQYVADSIVRMMSYLRRHQRPLFIKTVYTTSETWRELTSFDPTLVIGALGGPRQNARKTLQLAYDATEHGSRVILFGRSIFEEDDPRLIVKYLRAVLDRTMTVDEAHGAYQRSLRTFNR
jgi:hypothetical protein